MDCGNPSPDTGYIPATPGSTAENGTASVSCDNVNGYTGTAADITCQANGTWTAYSGCTGMLIMNYGQYMADSALVNSDPQIGPSQFGPRPMVDLDPFYWSIFFHGNDAHIETYVGLDKMQP